jgi:hypothetical protein
VPAQSVIPRREAHPIHWPIRHAVRRTGVCRRLSVGVLFTPYIRASKPQVRARGIFGGCAGWRVLPPGQSYGLWFRGRESAEDRGLRPGISPEILDASSMHLLCYSFRVARGLAGDAFNWSHFTHRAEVRPGSRFVSGAALSY